MKPKLNEILNVALATLGVDYADWENYSRSRQQWIVRIKELYSLLALEQGYSRKEIGKYIHHHRTTIIHYIKTLKDHCSIYPKCNELIEQARVSLKSYVKEEQLGDVSYGYLARTSSGFLIIAPTIPNEVNGYWIAEGARPYYPQSAFPQITKETGPVKVKIKVTIEDHEEM